MGRIIYTPGSAVKVKKGKVGKVLSFIEETASGAVASFDDGADGVPVRDLSVGIEPVQEGSGDPAPDNVRPISGWDRVKIIRNGKNFFNYEEYFDSCVEVSGSKVTRLCLTLDGNTDYTVSTNVPGSESLNNASVFSWKGGIRASNPTTANNGVKLNSSRTITTDADGKLTIGLCTLEPNTGITMKESDFKNGTYWIQIEKGSSATEYEPYTGITVTIDLGGTVYGGTLNVTAGLLTIDRIMLAFSGAENENWSKMNSGTENWYYYVSTGYESFAVGSQICNKYPIASILNNNTTQGTYLTAAGYCRVRWGTEDTIENWKAALSDEPMQIIGKLSEPLAVQLAPAELMTLLGENHIRADTGTTAVTYRADTKMYIDGKIAELQALILEN